ncbi:MAG TPA: NADH-quinone oxidoreductase subunit C/D [Armatimonadota bacterium]|nr:NADH-quinone oxidoreductase subunit C/D [Armatimonadota bacterium]
MDKPQDMITTLQQRFPDATITPQSSADVIPTCWVDATSLKPVLRYLKEEVEQPFKTLYDLTAVDERERIHRDGQPASDFTVVYHLLSYERNADIRVKVPLQGEKPSLPTITDIWPAANWYEREVWDMFGVTPEGHPHLRRILMPPWWEGHPLRKEHPARATEMGIFQLPDQRQTEQEDIMQFVPDEWGMRCELEGFDCLFLNIGPHHPGTHGVLRIIAQMAGQEIADLICDIGFHHRAAEKTGERQSWHTYIPYTDRVDYLSGVLNNFPYVMAVERLAGIHIPDRAKVIRIMTAELFRIINHLVFLGTFSQDLGMMSPVFYMFTDRERAFAIIEAFTGARMHPAWFRIGGVAQDLPHGWDTMMRDFIGYMRPRLAEYEKVVLRNRIFRQRTRGIGQLTLDDAITWGATGPMLRGSGLAWDFRKDRPYGGYEQFDFDVPTGTAGDCYDRAVVHMEEMWQSLRIIEQCVQHMPDGPYKSHDPQATPPVKPYTMHDIETLINHFLGVSWGPVIPAGEASIGIESSKGNNSYYLISDGNTMSYRTRIRTPSFAHIQMVPLLSRGLMISDLIAILGSIDFVLSDVDR